MAVQRGKVHRPLPGKPGDLVLRLGLWRQRPAGQEVLRPAHRLGDGAGRGLAGRAHADPEADLAAGRVPLCGGGLPQRLRQDQHGHAPAHPAGLEGGDHRRRHLLDALRRRWPPLCDQSGSRVLRRCAGHRRADQQERHRRPALKLRLHQRGADRGRRRLVGRPDRHAARPSHGLARSGVDPRLERSGGAPELALHRAGGPVPDHRAGMGRPARRADLGHPVRRPPRLGGAAGDRSV